ncbi:hypothetical protein, partial [Plasmodium yoelii yoelii]
MYQNKNIYKYKKKQNIKKYIKLNKNLIFFFREAGMLKYIRFNDE